MKNSKAEGQVRQGSASADGGVDAARAVHQILVVDSDEAVLAEASAVLSPLGYEVRAHADFDRLLEAGKPACPSCLLLGTRLNHGNSGLDALRELARLRWNLPTVITATQWNVELVVCAMRAGADGFVVRPFVPAQLRDAVGHALDRARHLSDTSSRSCHHALLMAEAKERVSSLNSRETEVVRLVVGGLLNKEIADQLDLALVTVKDYHARAMKKLGAGNPVIDQRDSSCNCHWFPTVLGIRPRAAACEA